MLPVNFSCGVNIQNMYIAETISCSGMINDLFYNMYTQDFDVRNKQIVRVPYSIKPYWTAIKDLHRQKDQILTDSTCWVWNPKEFSDDDCSNVLVQTCAAEKPYYVRYLYDVDDPDLCISSIDHHKYRNTLGICLEMFLRRQLAEYSTYFDNERISIRSYRRYSDIHLILPQWYFASKNPDDIRKLEVITSSFSTMKRLNQLAAIPNTTAAVLFKTVSPKDLDSQNVQWATSDGKLPKFRCRPALLNSTDCMQILFESTEDVSIDLLTKIIYHLRPFRFVLPLTFLLDIFGGWTKNTIVEKNFPQKKQFNNNAFTDNLLLMDEKERASADNCLDHILMFLDNEVRRQRRVVGFFGGGFLSHMLGLTNDHNGIDIFIEHNHEVYAWITQTYDSTVDANIPRRQRTLEGRNIWIRKDTHHPIFDSNHYMYHSTEPWNPWIIFRNHGKTLVKIVSVYVLNRTHPIVKHWILKYGIRNLPQIFFYRSCLKLHNYSIFKVICGFDLPINRNALVFSHANAFHLREDILNRLYGKENIQKCAPALDFVNSWKTDELREVVRIKKKVWRLAEELSPRMRAEKFVDERDTFFTDQDRLQTFLKHRRQMVLIQFPYDIIPNFNFDENELPRTNRVMKYMSRITNTTTDYKGNKTLPMKVYPLKYIAYWQLMKTRRNSIVCNCLCNFNYSNNKNIHDETLPSTSKPT